MRAVQIVGTGRPLEERTVEVDPPGPDDVVVKVEAAGICRSDVHFRKGPHSVASFPLTLGHEIAGTVVELGANAHTRALGDRVGIHYQTSCGTCRACSRGREQFCEEGLMFGRSRPGGFAEYVTAPERNTFVLPDSVSFEHGAVMMCSSATALHALRKGRIEPGESVAVFGVGGLGMSAVQLARALGAGDVYAVDITPSKLELAASFGAIAIDAGAGDAAQQIRDRSDGHGVDVALELIGLPLTMRQAIESVGVGGRAVVVGLGGYVIEVAPFTELTMREAEIIGCADHLAGDITDLFGFSVSGELVLDDIVGACVPLDSASVNFAMDQLEAWGDIVRTVIIP